MTIEKTDAHHHLWSLASPHYPILTSPPAERFIGNTGKLRHDFGAEQVIPLLRAQNVTRTVYVESHYDPPLAETAFVDGFAEEHGFPHAIVGRADLRSASLAGDLDVHRRSSRFRGVRTMVNWDADPKLCGTPDPHLLRDRAWRCGYAELGKRGLIAEVMALPAQLAELAVLAADHPETALVVGHTGLPLRRTAAEDAAWHEGMAALAAVPHVIVKISGLGMADHAWTPASIRPLVRETIALFGPDRAMFASNFPVDGLYSSYAALWDAFDAITADLGETERALVFSGTANRVFRLP